MKAIIVCVEYDDLLAITLPRNARHFDEVLVVTSFADGGTEEEAWRARTRIGGRVRLHKTDAFYRNGAAFNKGLAMEEGFDVLGRDGWICILDADTLLPDGLSLALEGLKRGHLYSPYRRCLLDPAEYHDDLDWSTLREGPERQSGEFAGYCQMFHGGDPVLQLRPWYGLDWQHAGGCDSEFWWRWPKKRRIRPDFQVLHLGPMMANWAGRQTARLDGRRGPKAIQRARLNAALHREARKNGGFLKRCPKIPPG